MPDVEVIEVMGLGRVGHRKGCPANEHEPVHHACWITGGGTIERVKVMPYERLEAELARKDKIIDQIRSQYHRERAYVERLEAQIHRERQVVEFARYWHKARGMHRAPWLKRLKDVVIELEAKLAHE